MPEHLPPMAAGLIGYMGYDTVRLVENIPDKNPDTLGDSRRHVHAPDADGDFR